MTTLTETAAEIIAYLDRNLKPDSLPDAPPTIAELLAQSRSAHLVYRRSLKHRANGVVVEGDPTAAANAVAMSARLRAQAELTDPKHADPAWEDDKAAKFPHPALMEFYEGEVKFYVPQVKAVPDPVPVDDVKDDAIPR